MVQFLAPEIVIMGERNFMCEASRCNPTCTYLERRILFHQQQQVLVAIEFLETNLDSMAPVCPGPHEEAEDWRKKWLFQLHRVSFLFSVQCPHYQKAWGVPREYGPAYGSIGADLYWIVFLCDGDFSKHFVCIVQKSHIFVLSDMSLALRLNPYLMYRSLLEKYVAHEVDEHGLLRFKLGSFSPYLGNNNKTSGHFEQAA